MVWVSPYSRMPELSARIATFSFKEMTYCSKRDAYSWSARRIRFLRTLRNDGQPGRDDETRIDVLEQSNDRFKTIAHSIPQTL